MPSRRWYAYAPVGLAGDGNSRIMSAEERRLRGELPGPDVTPEDTGPGSMAAQERAYQMRYAPVPSWAQPRRPVYGGTPVGQEVPEFVRALSEAPLGQTLRNVARLGREPLQPIETPPERPSPWAQAAGFISPPPRTTEEMANPLEAAFFAPPFGPSVAEAISAIRAAPGLTRAAARRAAPTLLKLATEEAGGVGRKVIKPKPWKLEDISARKGTFTQEDLASVKAAYVKAMRAGKVREAELLAGQLNVVQGEIRAKELGTFTFKPPLKVEAPAAQAAPVVAPEAAPTFGQGLMEKVRLLDERGATDTEYRGLLSTGAKAGLKHNETWRGRVLRYAKTDLERYPPEAAPVPRPAAPPAEAVAPRDTYLMQQALKNHNTLIEEEVKKAGNRQVGMKVAADRVERLGSLESGVVNPDNIRDAALIRQAAEAEGQKAVGTRPPQVAPQPAKAPLPPPVAAPAGAGGPPARPARPSVSPRQEIPPVVEGRPPVPPAPSEPLPPTIRPPEPIPPGPGEDPIQRALDYAKVQVERERPGFITRVQTAIPGVRQARIAVQKALDMPKHILKGWVAQGNVEGMLAQELAVSRIPLLKRLESTFGKGVASTSSMKVPGIRFIGTPDQVAPFNGTLYDIMQRPHLYDLRATEKALLEELQQAKSGNLNRLRQGYQLEIGEFPTEPGSVHLPNVDVSESALDVTGSVEAALRRGRAKERFYKTGFDRWQHDRTFKPETNVANLLAADDQTLVSMAGKQVYAKGIGGKTRLEAMQETHPVLAAKMDALKRRLNSLKATEGRLDAKQQQAVENFLASSVEEADLATLREGLEPAITRGRNIGKTQADINRELQGVRAQIAALQPAWRVANLKPYQFVQEGGYRYFKLDEAEHVRRLAKISQNRFVRVLDDIRGGKLSGDFSPGTIQGVILITSDPIGTGRLAASEFKMAFQKRQLLRPFTEEGLLSWVQENPELARRFSEATGMSILEKVGPEWAGGWVGKVPGIGKPWAVFNDAIFRPLKRAGLDVFKSSYEAAQGLGLSEKEAMAVAADDVRKIIPRWNFRLLGQSQAEETWMRAPLTSVSFLTQTAALFTDAVKGYGKLGIGRWGSITPNERFAIKRVTTMIASIEITAVLSNVKYALDHDLDVEQAIRDSVNPESGKFMAIVLPELKVAGRVIVPEGSRVTVGGPMRSLVRAVVPRMVKVAGVEVPLPFVGIPQYLQGKLGPGPRIPFDLLRNEDFYGNKIMTGEFPMNIVQGLAYVAESAMPLSISGPMAVRRQGYGAEKMIAEGVSQLGGTSLNLQTPSQGRNEAVQRWARTQGIKTFEDKPVFSYYELTGEEARQFDREYPAEAQAVQQDIDRRAALGDENALIQKDKLERYDRQLVLDKALESGKITDEKGKKEIPFSPKDWRESYGRQQVESAATRAILEKIRNKTYPEPENEGEKALKGYYDLMETFRIPESGYFRVEDWVEARERYLAGLGTKEAEYVKKKLHPWATPTVRKFLKAQETLRPYWELEDKITRAVQKEYPNFNVEKAIRDYKMMKKDPNRLDARGYRWGDIASTLAQEDFMQDWAKRVKYYKEDLRRKNKPLDEAGKKWYGWTPLKEKK